MYLLIFLLVFPSVETQTCHISVPIGSWLENNTRPCNQVIGHFILDQSANKFTTKLFSAFSNLTRIEGCIHVEEFTGSRNLSFFSKLQDVICDEKIARESNLEDVIFVSGPNLDRMGFNSLKTVEGPGDIFLTFEEGGKGDQEYYMVGKTVDGKKCFSKEEMIFLAYQRKFKYKMYQPCAAADPCFGLDHRKKWYQLTDIPSNCTTFVGLICAVGPFEEDAIRNRFQNLTLLIGQLQVMGTLFDSLDFAFPNLQNIYPYERPNLKLSAATLKDTCNDYTWTTLPKNDTVQYTHIVMNRFLKSVALPSLRFVRPLDFSVPWEIEGTMPFHFDPGNYIPDTIENPCSFFPGHECGHAEDISPASFIENRENTLLTTEIYVISIIFTIIGVFFSYRSLVLLMFSKVYKSLPYSRWLIILVISINTLTAIESCFIYQRIIYTYGFYYDLGVFYSEFSSLFLIYLPVQFMTHFLAASRHVCLVAVILCYLDTIIYYKFESQRISKLVCTTAFILACILFFFIYAQLFVAIRSRRLNYFRSHEALFLSFTLDSEYLETFRQLVPDTRALQYANGRLTLSEAMSPPIFELDAFPFDNMGRALPNYTTICDFTMLGVVIIFHILAAIKFVTPRHGFSVLIFLYVQLASNRIAYFIYMEVLTKNYCKRQEFSKYSDPTKEMRCYKEYVSAYFGTRIGLFGPDGPFVTSPPFMTELQWNFLEKLLEKLPYISYPIVSFACYCFARYHSLIGALLHYRENKPKTEEGKTITDTFVDFVPH